MRRELYHYNKNHDPRNGQFTSGPGGASSFAKKRYSQRDIDETEANDVHHKAEETRSQLEDIDRKLYDLYRTPTSLLTTYKIKKYEKRARDMINDIREYSIQEKSILENAGLGEKFVDEYKNYLKNARVNYKTMKADPLSQQDTVSDWQEVNNEIYENVASGKTKDTELSEGTKKNLLSLAKNNEYMMGEDVFNGLPINKKQLADYERVMARVRDAERNSYDDRDTPTARRFFREYSKAFPNGTDEISEDAYDKWYNKTMHKINKAVDKELLAPAQKMIKADKSMNAGREIADKVLFAKDKKVRLTPSQKKELDHYMTNVLNAYIEFDLPENDDDFQRYEILEKLGYKLKY